MAQDEFSTMMGWEEYEKRCSIFEFKEYLQTPDLSSKEKMHGWVFWYPKIEEYDFAQVVQQNSNVCEEDEREKIKSVLEALTSFTLRDDYIVQYWRKKVVAGQLCLTTVGQPFAVSSILRKGYCWYRKHCEDHLYIVKEEGARVFAFFRYQEATQEEVGSVGRAFLNMKVESSPDLRLYSIQEFPLRNHAARTGLTTYLVMPVFDLLNKECYGVLEILSQYSGVGQTFSLLDRGLKEAGLRSTHIHSSPIDFFNESEYVLANGAHQPESEIVKMMESAMEAVPQLQTVQLWTPCNQCITTTNTLTCLERTAFIHFKDKKLNSCKVNTWEDLTMLNFLKACEFHHLQIEEWIGRPLMSVNRRSSFCRSICDFSICEYPLAHYAQKARLSFCFVIHLQNIYDSNNHCFLEFFVQPNSRGDACDASFLHLLLRIMEMELKNFKFDESIFELRKTSALGYEYVEWKHQHSEDVNMLTVMKGHTEKYSLSDFKIYLQTPDLSCLQLCEERMHVWLFWREDMSYNEGNNNRGMQEKIRKLMMAIISKCSLVQFWALGMNESRPCLQTSHQPFALGSLNKGLAFFRKQCMERRYFVDDGADGDEVGPPQRVFRNGHHESSPDLQLYSTTEFPLRDHALHCCLKRYIAFPILDQHKKCIGVLECVGVNDDDDHYTIRKALKATSLSSTHINFKPNRRVGSRRLAEIELHRAFDLFWKIPQLFHKDAWVTYNKCDSISSNICCMERLQCADIVKLDWPNNFRQVQTGKGIVGMVLASENKVCFCRNLCDFSIVEQPRSHYLQRDRLDFCFAICLQSSHTGNLLYVLQFFLYQGPAKFEYLYSFLHILFPILKQELTSFKVASGQQLGDDLVVDVIEFPQGNKFTSSELDESYSSPFKFKIVHYGQKKPQHSIDELRHFVPSVLQEKSSNAATSESREKGVAIEKLVRKRNGSLHIRLEDLEPHFWKKIEHAADALGVGRSTIKRACRIHGIDRWPSSEKYIKNPRLFEAAGTSHDFQHSHSTNLPPPYVPVTELQPEAEMAMVKAKYEDEIIKFKLCLSATMNKLQKEVAKRLDLEIGSFKLRYLDEDNDKIFLSCDDDLQLCLKGLTAGDKTCVQVFVQLIQATHNPMARSSSVETNGRQRVTDMPYVSTRGFGPNNSQINGFLYCGNGGIEDVKIEDVKIVCVCHGLFLSPAEFVKHGGGGDVRNPLKHIVVTSIPFYD
ncbi:hypothetical protein ACS0TY_004545 [Phlomoides rotata]